MTKANSVNPLQSQRAAGFTEGHYLGHIRFVSLSAFWLLISVILVYVGVRYGPQVLSLLKSEGGVDLQTMGELLGGALGVTVAFAGAWVAIKVASFAFEALEMQETREALETANKTLEKSIGIVLRIQADFERLLRHMQGLQEIVDNPEKRSDPKDPKSPFQEKTHKQVKTLRKEAGQDVQSLAKSIKALLSNPLALSAIFALQKERSQDADNQQILQDLSQAPRWLATVAFQLAAKDDACYADPFGRRRGSPFDAGLRLIRYRRSLLEEALSGSGVAEGFEVERQGEALRRSLALEDLAVEEEEAMKCLSYLTHLTNEYTEAPGFDIHEPRLLGLLRYFIYTPKEAQKALREVFKPIYHSERIRRMVLESGAARAFGSAGHSHDDFADQRLRESERITQRLKNLLQEQWVTEQWVTLMLQTEHVSERSRSWEKRQSARRRKLLKQWGGAWSAEKARNEKYAFFNPKQRELADINCYKNLVVQPLLQMLAAEMGGASAYEAYRIILQEYEEYHKKPDPADDGIIFWLNKSLRRARIAQAERELQGRIENALQMEIDEPIRQDIREESAKLCRLAEEARALKQLSECTIPEPKNEGEENVHTLIGRIFTELRNELNTRLVDSSLDWATARERDEICQHIKQTNLWPALVSRICFILRVKDDAAPNDPLLARFRSVLDMHLKQARPAKALAQVCLHYLDLQGIEAREIGDGERSVILPCRLPVRVEADIAVEACLSLRDLRFDDTKCRGEAEVEVDILQGQSLDEDDEVFVRAELQAYFLGYTSDQPEKRPPVCFKKTAPFSGNVVDWLDATLLELRLIQHTYAAVPR